MANYTVDEFLESVKVRCLIPDSNITFQDIDILRFANEELSSILVPDILKVREEFYVVTEAQSLVTGLNARYPIPSRAIGCKLRNIQFIDGSGNKFPLTRIENENTPYFEYNSGYTYFGAFFIEGNDIVVLGTNNSSQAGDLLLSYYLRPNDLVEARRAGIITQIDRTGDGTIGYITISNSTFPSNLTTSSMVDFIQSKPNYRTYDWDLTIQNINTVTKKIGILLTDIPDNLIVGDYICSAGETIVPQVPKELHPMLAQTTACRVLEALGDNNNLQIAYKKLEDMRKSLLATIENRTEGNQRKILNSNSLLFGSRVGYRRNRG